MHWTILIKSHPDASGNPVLQGLRMAAAALADGILVSLFLSEEAASLALQLENPGDRQRVHHDLIAEIQELGAEIYVNWSRLDACSRKPDLDSRRQSSEHENSGSPDEAF